MATKTECYKQTLVSNCTFRKPIYAWCSDVICIYDDMNSTKICVLKDFANLRNTHCTKCQMDVVTRLVFIVDVDRTLHPLQCYGLCYGWCNTYVVNRRILRTRPVSCIHVLCHVFRSLRDHCSSCSTKHSSISG